MTIPLIQGTIKYVYKSDPAGGASGTASSDEKSMAEGWAFAAALLPLLNAVDSSAADTLYNNINMDFDIANCLYRSRYLQWEIAHFRHLLAKLKHSKTAYTV